MLELKGLVRAFGMDQAVSCGGLARVRAPDYFGRAACISIHNDCPTLSKQCFRSEPPLSLTSELSPWPPLPSSRCGAVLQGPVWNLGMGWGVGDGGLASEIGAAACALPV